MAAKSPFQPVRPSMIRRWINIYGFWPKWLRYGVPIVAILVLGATGGTIFYKQLRANHNRDVLLHQERLGRAVAAGDEDEILAEIAEIQKLEPAHARCGEILEVVKSGHAPESDSQLCALTMLLHLRHDKLAEASREAEKRLKTEPGDWNARCTIANFALRKGERQNAVTILDGLPNPEKAGPSAMGLIWAFDLKQRCGMDVQSLRAFIDGTVVGLLDSPQVEYISNFAKLQMIECYMLGFDASTTGHQPTHLANGIAPAFKLMEQIEKSATEKKDIPVLVKLGELSNRLFAAFDLLLKDQQLGEAKAAEVQRVLEKQTQKVWDTVLKLDGRNAKSYHGQVVLLMRQNRWDRARDVIGKGIEVCDSPDSLLALYSLILQHDGEAAKALDLLKQATAKDPKNLNLWLMLTEVGLNLKRADVTLDACREARKLAPNHLGLIIAEVRAHLLRGDPHSAVQRFEIVPEQIRLSTPGLVKVYVQCRTAAGLLAGLPDVLKRIEEQATSSDHPLLLAQAVQGLLEAPYDAELWAGEEARLDRMSDRWPLNHDLQLVMAQLHYRKAMLGMPRWETDATRDAMSSLERVLAFAPTDMANRTSLAWLLLKGQNKPQDALKACQVIEDDFLKDQIGLPDHRAIYAAVLAANSKWDLAEKVAQRAMKLGASNATPLLVLAQVAWERKQKDEAKSYLEQAGRAKISPDDESDLLKLQKTLLRETP